MGACVLVYQCMCGGRGVSGCGCALWLSMCSLTCYRRAFTPNGNSVCRLRVAVDSRFFTNVAGSDIVAVNNEVTSIFNEVNQIYSTTDFNFDRQVDGIRFALEVEIYQTADQPAPAFADSNIKVNTFLDLWSEVRGSGAGEDGRDKTDPRSPGVT